jgi:hypothetical protein
MMARRAVPALLLALCLAGCSSAEDEPRPLLDLPKGGLVTLDMDPARVAAGQLRPGAGPTPASLELAEAPGTPTFPGEAGGR